MNTWQEKLSLLKYRGGIEAALFWLVKVLFKAEVYFFYAVDLSEESQASGAHSNNQKKNQFQFISLNTDQDLSAHPHDLIKLINAQSGWSVPRLIGKNAGVYALTQQGKVVTQTNISSNTVIEVDTPTDLNIHLDHRDVFLGYLYTYPEYRGKGAAAILLRKVCKAVFDRGYSRIVTHVRSTNIASLNTFRKCGWSRKGWIVTSLKGHLLLACFPRKSTIKVSSRLSK